jgi:hypothetical protein
VLGAAKDLLASRAAVRGFAAPLGPLRLELDEVPLEALRLREDFLEDSEGDEDRESAEELGESLDLDDEELPESLDFDDGEPPLLNLPKKPDDFLGCLESMTFLF